MGQSAAAIHNSAKKSYNQQLLTKKIMTLGDRLAIWFIRRVNSNPEKCDRVVKKMQHHSMLATRFLYHRPKKGFVKTIENLPNCKLEVYKNTQENAAHGSKKIIYVVHGGGFIMGLINVYRNLVHLYSRAAGGATVALVDYRTAPAHVYPAAHNDTLDGYKHILDMGYAPRDIILVGESSGGNLILSLLLKLKSLDMELPRAAVVMSAWTDLTASGKSYRDNYKKDAIFGRKKSEPTDEKLEKLLKSGFFCYAGDHERTDPFLSPIFGDYSGMPPILMTVGENEILLDDTLTVAEKIKKADGTVEVLIGKNMFHGYPLFYKISKTAKAAHDRVLEFIGEKSK